MASDVMRVRLHLRQIRVLAVVVDTPSELRSLRGNVGSGVVEGP